jgi:prolipoprotein diacylglyceryltransferase
MLYASARFLVEFVRFHEQPNPFGGPLDTTQWISLALFALGAARLLVARRETAVQVG